MTDDLNQTTVAEPEETATTLAEDPPAAPEGWNAPAAPPAQQGFAKLVVKRSGAETDIAFSISPPAIIGRFDPAVGPIDVDMGTLPEGSYVSRKHAKITCDEEGWKISDLGSSNGTFVLKANDFERVDECVIEDGSEIALGNARLVFHVSEGANCLVE